MKYDKSLRSLHRPKQNLNEKVLFNEIKAVDLSNQNNSNNQNAFKAPNNIYNNGKFRKSLNFNNKKKKKTNRKKDEENILSKDIDVEDEMKELELLTVNKGVKPRDLTNVNISKNFVKNIKFKPMKYKGNFLPYHLRWIFQNTVV
jgi:hypothetical protein